MSWGEELWDCAEEVFGQVTSDNEDVFGLYGRFIKERGEAEREYAKSLRKLCDKYLPRGEKKESRGQGETSKERAFRLLLTELGYQAGQHEQLSEIYTKNFVQDLKTKVKEDAKLIERYRNEIKSLQQSVEKAQKSFEKSGIKYKKINQDWLAAEKAWQNAESDCSVSRREVEKLRSIMIEKKKQCEEGKSLQVQQMSAAGKRNEEYLQTSLPASLNGLQGLSVGSGHFLRNFWLRCVQAEQEVDKVIQACHWEMERVVQDIKPLEDTEKAVEKYKTGNEPTTEVSEAKTHTIKRSKSSMKISGEKGSQTLYQQKRKLQIKAESIEVEITKGQREMSGLQLMIQSYTTNPQYGDATKFREELDRATLKVQLNESDLYALNKELSSVTTRLDTMRRSSSCTRPATLPHSMANTSCRMSRRDRSCDGSVASSTTTHSSGYPSTASTESASDKDNDSIEETNDYKQRIQSLLSQSDALYLPNTRTRTHNDSFGDAKTSLEDVEDYLPPPPQEILQDRPIAKHPFVKHDRSRKVVALYAFNACTDVNIPMVEGEQFYQMLEDQEGWTRVRRVDGRFFQDTGEGFVPTSFIQRI